MNNFSKLHFIATLKSNEIHTLMYIVEAIVCRNNGNYFTLKAELLPLTRKFWKLLKNLRKKKYYQQSYKKYTLYVIK